MKKRVVSKVATSVLDLTDPEIRKLAEFCAAGIPANHWIRSRVGMYFISSLQDGLNVAGRQADNSIKKAVLHRGVRFLDFFSGIL